MRKFIILSVVLLAVSSCNKASNTTPTIPTVPGTMSVDINGVPDTFNTRATAVQGSRLLYGGQAYGIHVIGYDDNGGVDSTSVNFDIEGGTPLTVGNYNSYNNSGASPYLVYFFYDENATGSSYDSDGGIGAPPDTIRITITSIDSTITHRIQGTFSGIGLNIPVNSLAPHTQDTLTNGKFDVPLSN